MGFYEKLKEVFGKYFYFKESSKTYTDASGKEIYVAQQKKIGIRESSIPKKWVVGIFLLLVLLVADTAIRLIESNSIARNVNTVVSIDSEFDDQFMASLEEYGYESSTHQSLAYNNGHKAGAKIAVYQKDTERLVILPWHRRIKFFKEDAATFMQSRRERLSGISYNDSGYLSFGNSEIDYQSVTYILIESAHDAIPFIDPTGVKGDVLSKLRSQIGGN
jgi:hypothetical protein